MLADPGGKHPIRWLASAAPTLCLLSCFGLVAVYYLSFELQLAQELTKFDQLFGLTRTPLPATPSEDAFLPTQVGDFQRVEIGSAVGCGRGASGCFYGVYHANAGFRIWMTISLHGEATNVLRSWVGEAPCGPEQRGEYRLQVRPQVSYLTHTCKAFFGGLGSLDGIAWVNGNWIIEIRGKPQALADFLKQYPYR